MCCHSTTKVKDQSRHQAIFSINQPANREPMLDFTLNHSETELQNEEDIFRGFSAEECEREGEYCLKSFSNHNGFIFFMDLH